MVNMTVIKKKDLFKYLIEITFIMIAVTCVTRYFSNVDTKKEEINILETIQSNIKKLKQSATLKCIQETMPNLQKETESTLDNTKIEKILNVELAMTKYIEKVEKEPEQEKNKQKEKQEEIMEEAKMDLQTEVIDKSGINTKYTNTYGSVQIKNESKYDLTEEILIPNIELKDKKDILIFHTHTCESYTQSEKYSYEPTGNYRTTDLNFSVARVGEELKKYLIRDGYEVVHDQTYHDYPAYTGSYNRSLITVKNQLTLKPQTEMVFDLHRDAVGSNGNYAPTVKIGDEYAAQIMFVIGTNGGGLEHSNWQQNLKFAVKIQEKANELYPGLFKPIVLRNSRYNQHVTKAANIIEVGATGNTLEQCLTSMKYLSKIINEIIK